MAVCLGDLDQRDLARLRTELVEVIAARFTYPAYYDFRAGGTRVRPISAARRQEIVSFVRAIILEPLARVEIGAPEVRRFLEQIFSRYVELNPELARPAARRRVTAIRGTIPQAAAEVQRGLMAFAAGAPGNFGAPRPAISWAGTAQTSVHRVLDWTQVERGTMLLQAALSTPASAQAPSATEAALAAPQPAASSQISAPSYPAMPTAALPGWQSAPDLMERGGVPAHTRWDDGGAPTLPPWLTPVASDPASPGSPRAAAAAASPPAPAAQTRSAPPDAPSNGRGMSRPGADAWANTPQEETAPLPAHLMQLNRSLFAGLESGSQSGIFGLDEELRFSDQSTGPQPSLGSDGTLVAPQEIPPDLIAMYSEYLRDLQPGAGTDQPAGMSGNGHAPAHAGIEARAPDDVPAWARGPVVSARPPASARASMEAMAAVAAQTVAGAAAGAAGTAGASDATTDRMIFAQLRQQLEAYLRQTARHYGVRSHGTEGAEVLGALRQARILDEADLRLAEGILALTDRILAGQPATQQDYRQAFMLYLLYHRRQVGV